MQLAKQLTVIYAIPNKATQKLFGCSSDFGEANV
jgi:hypothetical protein